MVKKNTINKSLSTTVYSINKMGFGENKKLSSSLTLSSMKM